MSAKNKTYGIILGTAQDGGYPHTGCQKDCCKQAWENPAKRRMVSCIAIVDEEDKSFWLLDATPDFRDQLRLVQEMSGGCSLAGILITHGHFGHYTGLLQLGREVMGAKDIPVYVRPRMHALLSKQAPWEQLVSLQNIRLIIMNDGEQFALSQRISIGAFDVPHRAEYTETCGFRVSGSGSSFIYIPDIDKWELWERPIEDLITQNTYAFLDGTFFDEKEINGRRIQDIPHPSIRESMERFTRLAPLDKSKVQFTHLNHTNPALRDTSVITREGFRVAEQGYQFPI